MQETHIARLAGELSVAANKIAATVDLLDGDATVPFIARYRKEATGGLDEVVITTVRDRIAQMRDLDKRRGAILKSLEERDLLTDELKQKIEAADTMAVLEDLYLPYKPKRRTRATIAREKGLEPLAEFLFAQDNEDPYAQAEAYVSEEKEVGSVDDALAGARDIIAEWVNEDADARSRLRELFAEQGIITSRVITGKETEGAKFSDYFEWEESVAGAPSHRILAMRRGETELFLRLTIAPPEDDALDILEDMFVIADNDCARQVFEATLDSYKRLLAPSLETEIRAEQKKQADKEAIRVFMQNLQELLMSPPLGRRRMLALDPGFRTGCKVVCLDKQGKLEYNTAVFPHTGQNKRDDAGQEIKALVDRFRIQVIAIGNGTASRETESWIRELDLPSHIAVEMVSEAGASIYSASEVAREEFPDHDVTVRGAVSIGRRLMDPLAELVKIDPKSIGVGQYQHDVDQSQLRQGLDDTVMICVNRVGVDINTASQRLLTYVSGLGPQLARNIVDFRDENGPFKARKNLLKVPRLGPKAYEQAAGFLRISDATNPLDRSAVHPESYHVVETMARDLGCTVDLLMQDDGLRNKITLNNYVSGSVGMPTLQDIVEELAKPGRDPRPEYQMFSFDDAVKEITDLEVGMRLPGIVTNVTNFGAFIDIGVHQDGLAHISQLADKFVKDPAEVVRVHQKVTVTVLDIDIDRRRISLSLRSQP